jgi:hypothetical protein
MRHGRRFSPSWRRSPALAGIARGAEHSSPGAAADVPISLPHIRGSRSPRSPHVTHGTDSGAALRPGARRTTQPPCLDVVGLLPELAGRVRTTVRLHPRRGPGPEPPRDGSKMGGTFYWRRDRAWPVCDEHRSALVGVLQLRKEEFPELGFPDRKNLFQLLWCPQDHHPWAEHRVYWHTVGAAPTCWTTSLLHVPRNIVTCLLPACYYRNA